MHHLKKYYTIWAKNTDDEVLRVFWDKLCASGVARMTFYEYMPKDSTEFCTWARGKLQDVRFICCEPSENAKPNENVKHEKPNQNAKPNKNAKHNNTAKDENILAMYWLNNPLGKAVMVHFCYTRGAFSEQKAIGEYVVQSLLFTKDTQGDFVLSSLMGLTPKSYRHALRFIEQFGFSLLGILPKSCFFSEKKSYKDGVISVLTRENFMRKVQKTSVFSREISRRK